MAVAIFGGNDIHTVPVVLSYLMISQAEVRLYANETVFSDTLKEKLEKAGVTDSSVQRGL